MTRDEWMHQFAAELLRLRPHLGVQITKAVAMNSSGPLSGTDPWKAAMEYHMRQESLHPREKSERSR